MRDRLSLCKEETFKSIVEGTDYSLVLSVPLHHPYAHLFIHPYSVPVSLPKAMSVIENVLSWPQ